MKQILESFKGDSIKDLKSSLKFLKQKSSVLEDYIFFSEKEYSVVTKYYQKFKKYEGIPIKEVFEIWSEDFIDEDTGEVITVGRRRLIGYVKEYGVGEDSVVFLGHSVGWNKERKEMYHTLGTRSDVLTYLINNTLVKVRYEE